MAQAARCLKTSSGTVALHTHVLQSGCSSVHPYGARDWETNGEPQDIRSLDLRSVGILFVCTAHMSTGVGEGLARGE